jgi:hypothetical protein
MPGLIRVKHRETFVKWPQDGTELQGELTLSDAEYLGATDRARTLRGRSFVFKGNRLRVFNFDFLPALHAIRLHFRTSYISCQAE